MWSTATASSPSPRQVFDNLQLPAKISSTMQREFVAPVHDPSVTAGARLLGPSSKLALFALHACVVAEATTTFLRGITTVLRQIVVPTQRLVVCRLAVKPLEFCWHLSCRLCIRSWSLVWRLLWSAGPPGGAARFSTLGVAIKCIVILGSIIYIRT